MVALAPVLLHHVATAPWIRAHQELGGSAEIIDELSGLFGAEDAVLFEARSRSGLVRFEAALGLDAPYAVYRLPRPAVDSAIIRSLARERARAGGNVYFVTTGYVNGLVDIAAQPVRAFRWQSSILEEFYTYEEVLAGRPMRLPRVVEPLNINFTTYRLLPDRAIMPLPETEFPGEVRGVLDVGTWDEPYVVGQLVNAAESDGEHSFRWTRHRGVFLLPGMPQNADHVVLDVLANSYVPFQVLEVWLDGHYLGATVAPERWEEVRFPVPSHWTPAANGVARIEIRTPAVRPAALESGGSDGRILGIRVDRVAWARTDSDADG
jgi:hypothetical protein